MKYLTLILLLTACTPPYIPKADCPYPCPTAVSNLSPAEQMAWFHKEVDKIEQDPKLKGQWELNPPVTVTIIMEDQ